MKIRTIKIMALLVLFGACTKQETTKVNAVDVSESKRITSAQFLCTCAPDTFHYRVWFKLSNVRPGSNIWLIFSEDTKHVSHIVKLLKPEDGSSNVIFIRHLTKDGLNAEVGTGALYITKGIRPDKGSTVTGILASNTNINTDCNACPNTPIGGGPYDTIPEPNP